MSSSQRSANRIGEGDTLKIIQPGTRLDKHLWMVISDPLLDPENIVIVNFTTWRTDKDQACVVEQNEHNWLNHKSCINYREAKIVTLSGLEGFLDLQTMVKESPLSSTLLKKIRVGVLDSLMSLEVVEILVTQEIIDC